MIQRNTRILILLAIFTLFNYSLLAQGIRGTVKNTAGEVLPNTSVFIPEHNLSSSTNANGEYAIKLGKGKYTVVISFIGYKTEKLQIEIKENWVEQNIVLSNQGYLLNEVTVGSNKSEDFAYTIMRKAIAKKKFHLLQYDSYQMRAYTKGTGELNSVPFLVRRKLAKEGVKAGQAYTTESVSQITFTRPNKVEEKVISVRTHGENKAPSASPTMFINQSFYNDKIGNLVSPLSSSAFAYYKFKYLGAFEEGELMIYKIAVIPRSKGDNIFSGTIYIIEDYWAIKGLELQSSIMGFPLKVKQQYAEVAKSVWLPITHNFTFSGKVFGFAGEYKYLVSCSNFKVVLNKDLVKQTVSIIEKADEPKITPVPPATKEDAAALIQSDAPMSRKQYVKLLEKYEKESLKEAKDPKVISERNFSIDSLAGKRDSAYWDTIRPVPLTEKEEIGYHREDSIADKVTAEAKKDSSVTKKGKHKFNLIDLLFGDTYLLSKRTRFTLEPTITQVSYNSVEGVAVNLKGKFNYNMAGQNIIAFEPLIRYGFASEKYYGKAAITYTHKKGEIDNSWLFEGGKFVEQFNSAEPILPIINTISTLFYHKNFMKLHEKQYAALGYKYSPSSFFKLNTSLEWSQRNQLVNQTDYSFFYKNRAFTPNAPVNTELVSTSFLQNQALTFSAELSYRPIQQYKKVDDRKIPLTDKSPEILLTYKKGINSVLRSDVDYDLLQLGFNHSLNVGAGDRLSMELKAGSFLNNKKMYFMDYHHFDANRTALTSIKPAGSFRLLDYYLYSTNNNYISAHTHYSFRKFLFTRIPEVRFMGLKENIFFNYLKTTESPNYYEVGYSLDNVFRFFRLEAAASFINRDYNDFGLRLGISTALRINGKN